MENSRFLPRFCNKRTIFLEPLQFDKAKMLKEIHELKKSLKKCQRSKKKYKEEVKFLRKKKREMKDVERNMSPLAREFFCNEIFNSTRLSKAMIFTRRLKIFLLSTVSTSLSHRQLFRRFLINHVSKIGSLPGHLHMSINS